MGLAASCHLKHVRMAAGNAPKGDGDLRPDQRAGVVDCGDEVLCNLALGLQPISRAHALGSPAAAETRAGKCWAVRLDHGPETKHRRGTDLRIAEMEQVRKQIHRWRSQSLGCHLRMGMGSLLEPKLMTR